MTAHTTLQRDPDSSEKAPQAFIVARAAGPEVTPA